MAFSDSRLDSEFAVLLADMPATVTINQKTYTTNIADLTFDVRNKYQSLIAKYKLSFLAVKSTFDATVKTGDSIGYNSKTYIVIALDVTVDNRLLKIHCQEKK